MYQDQNIVQQMEDLGDRLSQARSSIAQVFMGQDRVVDLVLSTLICGGHGLLIGLPGLGKTWLVDTLSTVMGLNGNRVQFTPDLMPADILGSEVLDTASDGTRSFRFLEGPVFCQLLMADEINRASPRTQSALLQAMQEREATIAGQNRPLGTPFHVLATQNPIEQEGTYPLPEAQLDRFMLEIQVPYPDRSTEREVVLATTTGAEQVATPVFTAQQLLGAQALIRMMPVGDAVVDEIIDLVRAFRPETPGAPDIVQSHVRWGPGPRAAQAMMMAVRAQALLRGSLAPSTDDIATMAPAVLNHRMGLSFAALAQGIVQTDLIAQVVDQVQTAKAAA